jgi:nitrite reductase/ring-hydroxylating ferredoxin subunit/DMSO/TMAO reductase YedYZ heme-binding membrane subunit
MSARHLPVGWTPAKRAYDLALALGIAGFVLAYARLGAATGVDGASLLIKAYGSAAFLLLSLALAIGPLARLDRRFLPLLYNRRHLGVATFVLALAHALAVLDWHFAFSDRPALVALLSSEPRGLDPRGLAFIPFGVAALMILFVLAATSHDFWLRFLTPPVWKSLHMTIYAAYALVVAHVAFGYLQSATNPALAALVTVCAVALVLLHLAAARAELGNDRAPAPPAPMAPWLRAGPADAIAEGRAIVVRPPGGEKVAIFRHAGRLSAVTNQCAHQNGPLGEGRVVDGCITCPWHGFQYRLEDGCAPPPYTEKLATYRLRLVDGEVWLDPRPNPPGTYVEPLAVPT